MPADIKQLEQLAKDLRGAGNGISGDVLKATRDTGDRIQKRAKKAAPYETGELRRSIKVTRARSRKVISVEITAESDHAVFQEYGTTRNPARPFMRPALHAEIPAFMEDLNEVLRDIW